jgi:hypothetical protein
VIVRNDTFQCYRPLSRPASINCLATVVDELGGLTVSAGCSERIPIGPEACLVSIGPLQSRSMVCQVEND